MRKRIFAGLLAFMMMLNVIPATEVSAASVSGGNLPTVSDNSVDEQNDTKTDNNVDASQITLKTSLNEDEPVAQEEVSVTSEMDLRNAVANNEVAVINVENDFPVSGGEVLINHEVVINGNNHTITGKCDRLFRVTKNATFNKITIKTEASNGRCIETRSGNLTLNLKEVKLIATGNSNNQTLTVGGNGENIKINLNACEIDAGVAGYGITTFNPAIINIDNETKINGYAALYFKPADNSKGSAGTVVNVFSGTLKSSNKHSTESNNFGTFVFEEGGVKVNVYKNATLSANSSGNPAAQQSIFWMPDTNGSVIFVEKGATITTLNEGSILGGNVAGNKFDVPDDVMVKAGYTVKANDTYYATLQEAINSVKDGTSEVTVELLADATIAETDIKCPMTFKGNGHTVTGTGKKMFRNFATATYENVTIVNETHEGRCIETRSGNMDLYLRNTTLKTTSTGNNQPLTVGGRGEEISVLLDKSMIDAGVAGYGITTFNPVTINIMEQSEVTGYAALYFKPADGSEGSKGTKVYVYGGSKLSSQNGHSGQLGNKNGFATVVFEDNGITFDADSTVSLSAVTNGTPEASQAIFGIKENITGINIYAEAAKVSAKDVLSGSDLSHEHHISLPSGYEDEIECSHSKESVFTGAWDATCTEDGNTGDYVCEYCWEITTPGTVVPATGHDFDKDGVCKNGCGTVLISEEDAKVEVQIQPEYVSGDVSETITSEEEKDIADFVANNIIVENMDAMVESVTAVGKEAAKDETLHAKAEAALTPAENEEIIVVVKPYLQSEIKAVDADATDNKALVSVEMNLVYDVVAKIDKESAEEVILESGKKVENPKPMDISFAIPGELIDAKALKEAGKVLYIEHPKADGSIYYHEASIEEFEIEEPDGTKTYYDIITFHNDKGFSEFNLMIGDEVPADKVVSTSTPAPAATIAMYAETGEYIEVSSVSESIIEEGKEELRALIGDSYGKYRLALAADLHADLKGSTKIKILVDDVTAADAVIILHKGADGWEAISNKAGDGYVIGKFSSLSPVLVFVDEDGELEAAQNATPVTTVPAGSTTPAPTGDSSMTVLWIGVLAIAAMAVVCTFVYNKKRRA